MSNDRPYSRVYWSILDDAKFDGIRDHAAHLGTWTLLLVVADMAYPSPAFLPPCPRASLAALANAQLIDLLSGNRYRVHGLEAERQRRSESARIAGRASGNARRTPVERPLNARSQSFERPLNDHANTPRTESNLDEDETRTRRDEDETRQDARPPMSDAIDYIEQRTGRSWQFRPGSQTWATLEADCRDFGEPAVIDAMRSLSVSKPDVGQLVFGASRLLHPIDKPKPRGGHNRPPQEGDDAFAA